MRYDAEKLADRWVTIKAAVRGTQLHELAKSLILLGVKLPKTQQTLNMFVNDAIGFRQSPEVVLFYSENCFGTTDAISYRREKNPETRQMEWVLRISDLKTGVTRSTMDQLLVYAAIFFLEYGADGPKPHKTRVVLRIYKSDEIIEYIPELDEIVHAMDTIVTQDRRIEDIKRGVLN